VKTLEEQAAAKEAKESAVVVIKSQLSVTSDENSNVIPSDGTLPEIEARLSGKNLLVRIHCEDRKGLLVKALSEIENQHLSIINTSVLPFSDRFLDITVMAQVKSHASFTATKIDIND